MKKRTNHELRVCGRNLATVATTYATIPQPRPSRATSSTPPIACDWPAESGTILFQQESLGAIEVLSGPPCEADSVQFTCNAVARCYDPIGGTDSRRQILRTRGFGISVWRGTASTTPVPGFDQSESDAPSRLRYQPCLRRCRSRPTRFIARRSCHARRRPVIREGLLRAGPQ